jgi:hypothetical protein
MKKLLYVIVLLVVTSFIVTSCTEEVVKPKGASLTGGGVVE